MASCRVHAILEAAKPYDHSSTNSGVASPKTRAMSARLMLATNLDEAGFHLT